MKIAIFYENKFEETEHIAQFLAHQVGTNGNEIALFKMGEIKPIDTLNFAPDVILMVTPPHNCKWPCHFGKTASYIKKFGKLLKNGASADIKKIGLFNCNESEHYNCKLKDRIRKTFPKIKSVFFPSIKTNYYRLFEN